jgi:NAD(P)-dependent dehydrogenase (short-subunit alcohol dehydrogenase family)
MFCYDLFWTDKSKMPARGDTMSEFGKLRNKVAVITGGTSGIGLATARLFEEEGAKVVVSGRREEGVAAARAALGTGALVLRSDVADTAEARGFYGEIGRAHGGIDVLFLNAGIVRNGLLADLDEAAFDEVMRVNVRGVWLGLKHASHLLRAGGAVVVNTSVANRLGVPGGGAYAASKAALRSLVRTAAAELLESGVRVNAISPGPTDTPVYEKQGLPPEAIPEVRRRLALMVPQRRLAAPNEIARAVLFLACADASFMTGEELAVNGGLSAF